MPTNDEIREVLHRTLRGYDVQAAYLFGSYARGEQTPASDVDIRLLCGHDIRLQDLMTIEEALESGLGCPVDIVSAAPEHLRKHFYRAIAKDEVQVYAARRARQSAHLQYASKMPRRFAAARSISG